MKEEYVKSFEKAKDEMKTADHLAYVTYNIVKDNKIIPRIIDKTCLSLLYTINAILQREYLYKRITLYKDSKDNIETFKKIHKRYNIDDYEFKKICEILEIAKKHKFSELEFSKNEKIVIVSGQEYIALSIDVAKEYILIVKNIHNKIQHLFS